MTYVYIFVEGGVIQGVRATEEVDVTVVDYDDADAEGKDHDEFEEEVLGETFAALEKRTVEVY